MIRKTINSRKSSQHPVDLIRYPESLPYKSNDYELRILQLKKKYMSFSAKPVSITPIKTPLQQSNSIKYNTFREELKQQPIESLKKRLDKSLDKYRNSQTKPQQRHQINKQNVFAVKEFNIGQLVTPKRMQVFKTITCKPPSVGIKRNPRIDHLPQNQNWLTFLKQQIQLDKMLANYLNIFPLQLAQIIAEIDSTTISNLLKGINKIIPTKNKQVKQQMQTIIRHLKQDLQKCNSHWEDRFKYKITLPNNNYLLSLESLIGLLSQSMNYSLTDLEAECLKWRMFSNAEVINIQDL